MNPTTYRPSAAAQKVLLAVVAISAAVFLVGLLVDPAGAWTGYLIGFGFVVGMAVSGTLFVAIAYVSNARWCAVLRRLPEAMGGTLPYAAGIGLLLIFGVHSLYEWSHPGAVSGNHLLEHKAGWLNVSGFSLRMVAYFGLWIWLTHRLLRESRAQDLDGDRIHQARNLKNGALFMAVLAVTWSLASIDWFESLQPEWFSTMFALQTISGAATSGLALVMLLAVLLRRRGPLRGVVREDHLDDLGKIAIALSLFWVYIWFCQYMLIWYGNMPEETMYFQLRAEGGWPVLNAVSLVLNWAVPFFVLMPKRVRRSGGVILRVAVVMLIGRLLDLYVMIAPPLMPEGPTFGIWELAALVGCLALFAFALQRSLTRAPLVPVGDAGLQESLEYHC